MRIAGAIRPLPGAKPFYRHAWLELVSRRPEFRLPQPFRLIDPLTRKPQIIQPHGDVFAVVLDEREVGKAVWTWEDDGVAVFVSVESVALHLVKEWATELGGVFREGDAPSAPPPSE